MALKGGGPDNELGYYVIRIFFNYAYLIFTNPKASSASFAIASNTVRISSLFFKGVLKGIVTLYTVVLLGNS